MLVPDKKKSKYPRLAAKAAESRHLVKLLPTVCKENATLFSTGTTRFLPLAAKAYLEFHQICEREPRRMSPIAQSQMERALLRFLHYWQSARGHCVFKHHTSLHVVRRARKQGNPLSGWTYADENENRLIGNVAKKRHGGKTFYVRLLERVLPEAA